MIPTRRSFLRAALAGGSSLGLFSSASAALGQEGPAQEEHESLDLLILGGTGFLGPHVVQAALARGHRMTLFNRGVTNSHLFPDLEKLKGNRDPEVDEGLSALEGRYWDGVIDTSAYVPRLARASAEVLADQVEHYVFVSTISVYAGFSTLGMDEGAPVGTLDDPAVEEVGGTTYGPLKALCEAAIEEAMPGRAAHVRPGLIVGPRDQTDRFTYWPMRVARGGEVLAPPARDPVQFIDVRDLAEWILDVLERRIAGVYNATGPASPMSVEELLYGCKAVTGGDARFVWTPADFLEEEQVRAWSDLPVWIPSEGAMRGLTSIDCAKAIAQGLSFRPLADTVRATLDWIQGEPQERRQVLSAGLSPERELKALAAWREREADSR